MEIITNKRVDIQLDKETGMLQLTGLLENTMLFLYDCQGEFCEKYQSPASSATLMLPRQGTYVLVMSHPNCHPEVRRIIYSGI